MTPLGYFDSHGHLLVPCRATDSRRDPYGIGGLAVRAATLRDRKALGLGRRGTAYFAAKAAGRVFELEDGWSCLK